jgi:hypothetical protein
MVPAISTVRMLQGMSASYLGLRAMMSYSHPALRDREFLYPTYSTNSGTFRDCAERTLDKLNDKFGRIVSPRRDHHYVSDALFLVSDLRPDSDANRALARIIESDPSWKEALERSLWKSAVTIGGLLQLLSDEDSSFRLVPVDNNWVGAARALAPGRTIAVRLDPGRR